MENKSTQPKICSSPLLLLSKPKSYLHESFKITEERVWVHILKVSHLLDVPQGAEEHLVQNQQVVQGVHDLAVAQFPHCLAPLPLLVRDGAVRKRSPRTAISLGRGRQLSPVGVLYISYIINEQE